MPLTKWKFPRANKNKESPPNNSSIKVLDMPDWHESSDYLTAIINKSSTLCLMYNALNFIGWKPTTAFTDAEKVRLRLAVKTAITYSRIIASIFDKEQAYEDPELQAALKAISTQDAPLVKKWIIKMHVFLTDSNQIVTFVDKRPKNIAIRAALAHDRHISRKITLDGKGHYDPRNRLGCSPPTHWSSNPNIKSEPINVPIPEPFTHTRVRNRPPHMRFGSDNKDYASHHSYANSAVASYSDSRDDPDYASDTEFSSLELNEFLDLPQLDPQYNHKPAGLIYEIYPEDIQYILQNKQTATRFYQHFLNIISEGTCHQQDTIMRLFSIATKIARLA
jgi:hypothetical protein